jgi:membrane fusion protein, multidrug efflux system
MHAHDAATDDRATSAPGERAGSSPTAAPRFPLTAESMNAPHSISESSRRGERARARVTPRALALAATLTTALLAAAACGGSPTPEAAGQTPADQQRVVLAPTDVVEVRVDDLTTGVLLTGSLDPAERVTLTAQVAGTVGPIRVDRGSPVRRGQALTTIIAQGVRSQAAGARANVAAAEANLAVAEKQRDAARRLYEAGATSAIEAQTAQARYEAAAAQVAAASAQAAAATEEAARTLITAPLHGSVSERQVDPGEAVRAGDPILTIVNTSALELAGRIPVDQAATVRVGQPVTFTLDAYPGREFRGSVARVDPAADPQTRQVGVYVRLPNPAGEIIAGQFARGRVTGRRITDAVVVPTTAVAGEGTQAAVYAIENGRLARRPVTVGASDDAQGIVAITSGLRAGERVLARPTTTIAEGTPVVVAAEQASSTIPPASRPANGAGGRTAGR